MIVMIDNYDSFTYNLVQYLNELGGKVQVYRNDEIACDEIEALNPEFLIFSPGPCTPDKAGVTLDAIRRFAGVIPILGVCLGHQAIGQAFGGRVVRADRLMHGKTSPIHHGGQSIFRDIPSPFTAARYHSLVVDRSHLPDCLEVSAWSDEGEVMGLRHRNYPVEGVQFHPESIMTQYGHRVLQNFLALH